MLEINEEVSQATNEVPNVRFEREKEYLKPLPPIDCLLSYISVEKEYKVSKDKVFEIHPELIIVYEVSKKFKELLMGQKIDMLNNWIMNTLALGIPELASFINGINRDIEAVENAIKYKYSNGLAEGTVNKIKVIKRIMYGRCGFNLLKRKVLYANFN